MGNFKNNYIIVCESRTGSTMLSTALWKHPQICSHGEILQPRQYTSKKRDDMLEFYGLNYDTPGAIHDLLRDTLVNDPVNYVCKYGFHTGRYKTAGFKFKYEEMECGLFDKVLDFLLDHTEIKIIHLTRDNLWHRYRSSYVAVKITKQFNSANEPIKVDAPKVTLDISAIEKSFKQTLKWQQKYKKMFENHDTLDLTYENILNNKQQCFDTVTEHLQVDKQAWDPWTKKVQSVPDDDIIDNMENIREHFTGTVHEQLFV